MKFYAVGIGCLAVAACTPSIPLPTPGPKAVVRPPSEVLAADALVPRAGSGAITVVRDRTRFLRKACIYVVALDGEPVAGLRNGEQATLYADPGLRIVEVSVRQDDDCAAAVAQVPVKVVASATTRIRIVADVSYDLRLEATTY